MQTMPNEQQIERMEKAYRRGIADFLRLSGEYAHMALNLRKERQHELAETEATLRKVARIVRGCGDIMNTTRHAMPCWKPLPTTLRAKRQFSKAVRDLRSYWRERASGCVITAAALGVDARELLTPDRGKRGK